MKPHFRNVAAVAATAVGLVIGNVIYKQGQKKAAVSSVQLPPKALTADLQPFKLMSKNYETPDVRHFRFELPGAQQTLGTEPGQSIVTMARINGEDFFKPYCPTTSEQDKGYFDLIVKVKTISIKRTVS